MRDRRGVREHTLSPVLTLMETTWPGMGETTKRVVSSSTFAGMYLNSACSCGLRTLTSNCSKSTRVYILVNHFPIVPSCLIACFARNAYRGNERKRNMRTEG